MSITLEGRLTVKSILGSRGTFCVGDLVTEVGNFRIKDALIDEFDPGTYRGKFIIGSIYPFSYTWRGRVSIEVRAKLLEIFLDDEDKSDPATDLVSTAPEPVEVDPIDEITVVHTPVVSPRSDENAESSKAVSTEPLKGKDNELFDAELLALIEAGGPVKLDPTVDRQQFRQQRDALKSAGFKFVSSAQHWVRN